MDAGELRTLEDCRRRIDELDRQLVELLNERARVSQRVGQLKANGAGSIYLPEREARVIRNVEEASSGPLPLASLRNIWTEILASSRALQRQLRVAYLGPAASFSYDAALRRFGRSAELVACRTIPDVFLTTARREADFGIVPVENSNEGGVDFTLDAFVDSELQACAEVELPISLCLVSHGTLDSIECVHCQRVAHAQCRDWLAANLPKAEIVEASSNATAVQLAKTPTEAGVGSASAAELYEVPILARSIEDNRNNFTRFLVIGDRASPPTGRDKTAIVFGVKHTPGALHEAMGVLGRAGLNLTRIESRPSKKQPWEYVFFIDFQGHPDDPHVAKTLEEFREHALFVKILGAWPEEARSR